MHCLLKLPLAAALTASGATVSAAAAATDASDQREIVITGERSEYGIGKTSTATKTSTPIRNIPQALTVISEGQIEDQQLRSVADLLNFVPGASYGSGESNRDTIVLRGNTSTADFFVDGIRDDVQYYRDLYNSERIEVLKGPNAMIFGRGGGGGVLNRVLKRPSLNAYRQLSASGDGFGGFRLTADLDQPLSAMSGLRLNAMYEDGDSFRRNVDLKRYGINPTAAVLIGPNTRVDIGYEYFHDRRTADRGLPADDDICTVAQPCEPFSGSRRTFFGDPDESFARADVNLATVAVEHSFGEDLTLRNRTLFGDYNKFYQNVYPRSYSAASQLVTLGAYNSRNDRRNLISQTDFIWENSLAGIDQTMLFGFEVGRQKSRNFRQTGTVNPDDGTVPASDPTIDADVDFANNGTSDANNKASANVAAVYIQDQIRPADWLEIVAGLRFDSFKLVVVDLHPSGSTFSRRDELWSPRLGVVIKPTNKLSFYTSYSRFRWRWWMPKQA